MPFRVPLLRPKIDLPRAIGIPAVLHVLLVSAMYLAGRLQVFPTTLDENGIGISFAIDSRFYRIEASRMAMLLHQYQFGDWWAYPAQPHVKLYSLSFAALGPFLGFNILSIEPLNLAVYLSIIGLVYAIGAELFGAKAGLIAAGVVAIWPSLFLHTTQMLRDPVFLVSFLALVLILIANLTRRLTPAQGMLSGIMGGCASIFLWLIRGDMWELVVLIVLVGVLMSIARQLLARQIISGNAIAVLLLAFVVFVIPRVIPTYRQRDSSLLTTRETKADSTVPGPPLPAAVFGPAEPTSTTLTKFAKRLGLLRHKFIIQYPLAGSNIDTDVELGGVRDAVTYFPRALEIGLFAPFPNMWLRRGAQVGLAGRLLSGFETLCMYVFSLLAFVSVVRNWRQLSVWLVISIILLGCAALGYVVVNVSTLYRMRYGFWILMIILGASRFISMRTRQQSEFELPAEGREPAKLAAA